MTFEDGPAPRSSRSARPRTPSIADLFVAKMQGVTP